MSHVCLMSLWRNDAERDIEARVAHLADKARHTPHAVTYLWLVGDSTDGTAEALFEHGVKHGGASFFVVLHDSGVGPGEDTPTRRRRFARNANAMFAQIPLDADVALLHESDILSPPDLVDRLLAGPLPRAAWPVLGEDGLFYDVYAFRGTDGRPFSPRPRHAPGWTRGGAPFRVSSFGTVWAAPAGIVRSRVMSDLCVVDLCQQWGREGVPLWCDPALVVHQRVDLWSPA